MPRLKVISGLAVALLGAAVPLAANASVAIVTDVIPGAGVGLGAAPACTITCPGPGADMLEALRTTSVDLMTIAHVQAGLPVRVVELDPAVSANARDIARANAKDAVDITRLRAAIEASGELKSELAANAVPVQSVIAADIAGDGGLILYAEGVPPHSAPMISLIEPEHHAVAAVGDERHRPRLAGLEADGAAGGNVEPPPACLVPIERQGRVGLGEVVMGADLDRPVAGVGDLQRHRRLAGVELDFAGSREHLARNHQTTPARSASPIAVQPAPAARTSGRKRVPSTTAPAMPMACSVAVASAKPAM